MILTGENRNTSVTLLVANGTWVTTVSTYKIVINHGPKSPV